MRITILTLLFFSFSKISFCQTPSNHRDLFTEPTTPNSEINKLNEKSNNSKKIQKPIIINLKETERTFYENTIKRLKTDSINNAGLIVKFLRQIALLQEERDNWIDIAKSFDSTIQIQNIILASKDSIILVQAKQITELDSLVDALSVVISIDKKTFVVKTKIFKYDQDILYINYSKNEPSLTEYQRKDLKNLIDFANQNNLKIKVLGYNIANVNTGGNSEITGWQRRDLYTSFNFSDNFRDYLIKNFRLTESSIMNIVVKENKTYDIAVRLIKKK